VSCAATSGATTTMAAATTTTAAYQVVATTTLAGAATATIQGSLALTVADPAAFAANVTVQTGLQNGIASMAGVNPGNVAVTLTASRRLDTDHRRLASGTVTVSYVITVAASDSASITSILTGKSLADVKTTIELALAAVGASDVTVTVTKALSAQATILTTGAFGHPRTMTAVRAALLAAAAALGMRN